MEHKTNSLKIRCVIEDDRAVMPTKAHPSDIGFDLTAIDVFKKMSDKTTLFETGIRVSPPPGYYIEILPRSSISKTGYVLANSVGVIDPHYTGTLKIALTKVDDTRPNLEPPFNRCQIVLRKAEVSEMVQVDSIDVTDRGDGGFGSTDKHALVESPQPNLPFLVHEVYNIGFQSIRNLTRQLT